MTRLRNMIAPNWDYLGAYDVGIPSEDIPSGGVAYEVAQEVDPDDLIRAEIYPPGQNLTMTEDTVPTYGTGQNGVIHRIWLNGTLLPWLYYAIKNGPTTTVAKLLRRRIS